MKGSLSHFYMIIFTSFHDMQPKLNETRHKQGTMARLPDLIKQRKGGSGVVLFRKNVKFSSNDMILRIFFLYASSKKKQKNSQFILGCETFSQALKPTSKRNIKVGLQYNKRPLVKTLSMYLFSPALGVVGGVGHPGQVGSLSLFYPDPLYCSSSYRRKKKQKKNSQIQRNPLLEAAASSSTAWRLFSVAHWLWTNSSGLHAHNAFFFFFFHSDWNRSDWRFQFNCLHGMWSIPNLVCLHERLHLADRWKCLGIDNKKKTMKVYLDTETLLLWKRRGVQLCVCEFFHGCFFF